MGAAWWAIVGVGSVLGALALMQLWMQIQTRRAVGRPIPDRSPALPGAGSALVYFFSPTCGPCRAMRPSIDALRAEGRPVVAVDVSRDMEIALAWNVLATPTTVVVRDGRIGDVLLGIVTKDRLEQLLAG